MRISRGALAEQTKQLRLKGSCFLADYGEEYLEPIITRVFYGELG